MPERRGARRDAVLGHDKTPVAAKVAKRGVRLGRFLDPYGLTRFVKNVGRFSLCCADSNVCFVTPNPYDGVRRLNRLQIFFERRRKRPLKQNGRQTKKAGMREEALVVSSVGRQRHGDHPVDSQDGRGCAIGLLSERELCCTAAQELEIPFFAVEIVCPTLVRHNSGL